MMQSSGETRREKADVCLQEFSTGVVPAKAGTHNPREQLSRRTALLAPSLSREHNAVWGPAFAGTTPNGCSQPSNTASAPVTVSAPSVTLFSSDGVCTETFSAKKRASAT